MGWRLQYVRYCLLPSYTCLLSNHMTAHIPRMWTYFFVHVTVRRRKDSCFYGTASFSQLKVPWHGRKGPGIQALVLALPKKQQAAQGVLHQLLHHGSHTAAPVTVTHKQFKSKDWKAWFVLGLIWCVLCFKPFETIILYNLNYTILDFLMFNLVPFWSVHEESWILWFH